MSHTIELWERVTKYKLRNETSIFENIWIYAKEVFDGKAIYLLRRLVKKFKEKEIDLHMVFIYLKMLVIGFLRRS